MKRATRSTGWPAIAGTLAALGTIAVTNTFAADIALLAGVQPADVEAHIRLGHIMIRDDQVVSYRGMAA